MMDPTIFYVAGGVAVLATLLAVTRANAVHALLYVVVSFLSVAVVFFALGAPLVGALEIVVYAGAIMVLFIFVVMLLDEHEARPDVPPARARWRTWAGPASLTAVLAVELVWSAARSGAAGMGRVGPASVGRVLLGSWVLATELAGMLLLAGLVAAHHLGRTPSRHRKDEP